MARFASEAELETFLGRLDPEYSQFASALWQRGVRTVHQLANAREPILLSCGLPELYIDDIKARADRTDDAYVLLDELLWQPLPQVDVSGSSRSMRHRDEDRHTHPTTVTHWSEFCEEVKERLSQPDIVAMRSKRYEKYGYRSEALHLGEDGVVSTLDGTACGRLNLIFRTHDMNRRFGIHPGKLKSDSQVAEQQHTSTVEMQPDEGGAVPDIVMLERHGAVRRVLFALEAKTMFRLKDVHTVTVARVCTMFRDGHVHPGLSADAAYNMCHAISQELGYMSRRGHLYGMVSTYHHSWFLKTDGKGNVWISSAVGADARGDAGHVSVTEAMLFSALCSEEGVVAPYPTARQMGEQPLSRQHFSKLRRQTLRPSTQAATTCHISPEVMSEYSGPQHSSCVTKFDLELAVKLSKTVFYGRFRSSVAVVRMALSVDDICDARIEVEAYHRLQDLQGKHVPRLLGYGQSGQGFCVVTSYIQGEPFDWHSHIHRTLDSQLLAVLDSIHSFGICHHDLHQGNILVTPYQQIVLLDFAGANLESTAEERIAERNHLTMLLSLKGSCHA